MATVTSLDSKLRSALSRIPEIATGTRLDAPLRYDVDADLFIRLRNGARQELITAHSQAQSERELLGRIDHLTQHYNAQARRHMGAEWKIRNTHNEISRAWEYAIEVFK